MARPQAFDREMVLREAMRVFWQYGYEGASLATLLQATKLSKSSLYAEFGSKHDLFLAAFDAYRAERHKDRVQGLMLRPARKRIEMFFQDIMKDAAQPELLGRGCMTVNQSMELAPHDPAVRQRVTEDFYVLERAFQHAVLQGQKEGEISERYSPEHLARLLVAHFVSIQIMIRSGLPLPYVQQFLKDVLMLFD